MQKTHPAAQVSTVNPTSPTIPAIDPNRSSARAMPGEGPMITDQYRTDQYRAEYIQNNAQTWAEKYKDTDYGAKSKELLGQISAMSENTEEERIAKVEAQAEYEWLDYNRLLTVDLSAAQKRLEEMDRQIKEAKASSPKAEEYAGGKDVEDVLKERKDKIGALQKERAEFKLDLDKAKLIQTDSHYNEYRYDPSFDVLAKTGAGLVDNKRVLNDDKKLGEKSLYGYMDSDQQKMYDYLLARFGEKSAEKYFDDISQMLKASKGQVQAAEIEAIDSDFWQTVRSDIYGFNAGLSSFAEGTAGFFTGKERDITARAYGAAQVREDLGELSDGWMKDKLGSNFAQATFDASTSLGNMAPSILLSYLTAGAAGALGASTAVAGNIGQAAAGASMFTGVYGNARDEMLRMGYTKESARTYAVLNASAEVGLEKVLGGFDALGGKLTNKAIATSIANVDNAFFRYAITMGGKMLGEGTEEYLQDVLDPLFRNIAFSESNDVKILSKEGAYSFLVACMSVIPTEGAGTYVDVRNCEWTGAYINAIKNANPKVYDAFMQTALNSSDKEVKELAGDIESGKYHASNGNLGQLAIAMAKDDRTYVENLIRQNADDVLSAANAEIFGSAMSEAEQEYEAIVAKNPGYFVMNPIESKLHELTGWDTKKVKEQAGILTKIFSGVVPLNTELETLETKNPFVQQLFKEFTGIDVANSLNDVDMWKNYRLGAKAVDQVRTYQEALKTANVEMMKQLSERNEKTLEAANDTVEQQKAKIPGYVDALGTGRDKYVNAEGQRILKAKYSEDLKKAETEAAKGMDLTIEGVRAETKAKRKGKIPAKKRVENTEATDYNKEDSGAITHDEFIKDRISKGDTQEKAEAAWNRFVAENKVFGNVADIKEDSNGREQVRTAAEGRVDDLGERGAVSEDRERGDRPESSSDAGRGKVAGRDERRGVNKAGENGKRTPVQEITEYNEEQTKLVESLKADGFTSVSLITGDLSNKAGELVNALVDGKGGITLRWDNPKADPNKVADHERIHRWLDQFKSYDERVLFVQQKLISIIGDTDTINALRKVYSEIYKKTYEGLSKRAFADAIYEEILCDVYGGMDGYGTNVADYTEKARAVLDEAGLRENALKVFGTNTAETSGQKSTQRSSLDFAEDERYNITNNTSIRSGVYNDRGRSAGDIEDRLVAGEERVDSDDGGGLVGNKSARSAGVVRLSSGLQSAYSERGISPFELVNNSNDHAAFSFALDEARNSDSNNGWAVTPKSAETLDEENVATFMHPEGGAGFGIMPDGDIVAVFKKKNGGLKRALLTLLPAAIESGGNKLDCYGAGLVWQYSAYGFIPVASVEFNPEYANPGWSPEKGYPPIYMMMHNGDSPETVVQNYGQYRIPTQEELDALPHFDKDGYEDAMNLRDRMLVGRETDQLLPGEPATDLVEINPDNFTIKKELPTAAETQDAHSDIQGNSSSVIVSQSGTESQEGFGDNPIERSSVAEDPAYIDYNRRALVSEDTLEQWLRDYAASNPNYAQAYIAYMSPSQFLKMTTDSIAQRQRIKSQSEEMTETEAQSRARKEPIFLRVDTETGEIQGHEGRHRMVALDRAGITQVPVLFFDSQNKYSKQPIDEATFRGQFTPDLAIVENLQPLSRGNIENVKQMFSEMSSQERMGEKYGGRTTMRFSVASDEDTNTQTTETTEDTKAEPSYPEGTLEGDVLEMLKNADNPEALQEWVNKILAKAEENKRKANESPVIPKAGTVTKISPEERKIERDQLDALIKKYGAHKEGENPARRVVVPEKVAEGRRVRQFLRTAEEAKGMPERGVEQIDRAILRDEAMSYEPISDKAAMKSAVNAFRTRGYESVRREWEGISAVNNFPTKHDIALGEQLIIEAARMGDDDTLMKVTADVAAMGTQAGQVVQAMRLLKKMSPTGQLYYVQKAVDRLNKQNEGRIMKGTMPAVVINKALAKAVILAENQEQMDAAMDKLLQDIADQLPVTFMDKWNSWRYLSMLGNPRTHIRNLAGNGIFKPVVFAKDLLAATLESTFIKDSDKRTKNAAALMHSKKYADLREFATHDFDEVEPYITGTGKQNTANLIMDKRIIFKKKDGSANALEKLSRLNSNLLEKEDGWFLKPAYVNAMTSYLAARGIDPRRTDPAVQKEIEAARQYATLEAQKSTYRDFSLLANKLNQLKRTPGLVGVLFEGLIPFTKTPINVLRRGFEYSPAGLIKTCLFEAGKLKRGDITAAEFIDHLAAGATGTAVAMLGLVLANLGIARGGDDDDEEKKNQLEATQGHQEYSLEFDFAGEKRSYTVDWTAPVALPFFIGVELQKVLSDDGKLGLMEMVDAMSLLTEPMLNLSMLDGISSALESASYSQSNKLTAFITNAFVSYVSQGLPTLGGQFARTLDPDRRMNYVDKNKDTPAWMQRFVQNAQGKIIGLENEKTRYYDLWGRTDTNSSMILRGLENFISPGYANTIRETPVDAELLRLYDATKIEAVLPSSIEKYFSVDSQTLNLTADQYEQYEQYAKVRGQTSYNALLELITSEVYGLMEDSDKATAIQKALDYAKQVAKLDIAPTYAATKWIQKANEFDISGAAIQYEALNDITGLKDEELMVNMTWLDDETLGKLNLSKFKNESTCTDYSHKKHQFKLDPAMQSRLWELYEEEYWSAYASLIYSSQWATANTAKRAELLNECNKDVAEAARKRLSNELNAAGYVSDPK